MSQQNIAILILTVAATTAITERRFVTASGAQAGAAANTLGVAKYTASTNELLAVDVIGTAVVEAGAAFAAGAALETDADGRAITQSAGPTVARALQAASGAGAFVEVLLIPN